MDWTILSAELLLSSTWQYFDLGDFNVIKITPLSKPTHLNTLSAFGRYEIGQFNKAEESTNLRAVRLEEKAMIFPLIQPPFFGEHILGIRLAPDFSQFNVKIEGLEMSVTSVNSTPKKINTNPTVVPLGADASKKILVANDKRVGISVRNRTTGIVALEVTDTIDIAAGNYLVLIPMGEMYESGIPCTSDIWAKGAAGVAGTLDVRESLTV